MERKYYAIILIAIIAISLTSGLLYYNNLPKGPALLSAKCRLIQWKSKNKLPHSSQYSKQWG